MGFGVAHFWEETDRNGEFFRHIKTCNRICQQRRLPWDLRPRREVFQPRRGCKVVEIRLFKHRREVTGSLSPRFRIARSRWSPRLQLNCQTCGNSTSSAPRSRVTLRRWRISGSWRTSASNILRSPATSRLVGGWLRHGESPEVEISRTRPDQGLRRHRSFAESHEVAEARPRRHQCDWGHVGYEIHVVGGWLQNRRHGDHLWWSCPSCCAPKFGTSSRAADRPYELWRCQKDAFLQKYEGFSDLFFAHDLANQTGSCLARVTRSCSFRSRWVVFWHTHSAYMSFLSQCIIHFCLKPPFHYESKFFQPSSFAGSKYKCIFRYVTQLKDVRPEGINSINISWAKTLKISWEKKDEVLAALAWLQQSQAQVLGGGNRLVKSLRCQWLTATLQGAQRFEAVEPRKHQSLWWHLPTAQQHQVGLPQPSEHLRFWGFSSFTESYGVAVPQSLQHHGIWGFSSSTESY